MSTSRSNTLPVSKFSGAKRKGLSSASQPKSRSKDIRDYPQRAPDSDSDDEQSQREGEREEKKERRPPTLEKLVKQISEEELDATIKKFGLKVPKSAEANDPRYKAAWLLRYVVQTDNLVRYDHFKREIEHDHAAYGSHRDTMYYLIQAIADCFVCTQSTACPFSLLKAGDLRGGVTIADQNGEVYINTLGLDKKKIKELVAKFEKDTSFTETIGQEYERIRREALNKRMKPTPEPEQDDQPAAAPSKDKSCGIQ